MTTNICRWLPIRSPVNEYPTRPPWRQRFKFWGMRAAGRMATVLSHMSPPIASDEFGILLYHRVTPPVSGVTSPTHNVSPHAFREQIVGLRRLGFSFLSLREVLRRRAVAAILPPRTAVITFDDGYESIYEFAWPILCELNVPASIFIATAYLDCDTPFPFDDWGMAFKDRVPPVSYRPLTSAQGRTMIASGLIELGAHTHTHADFRGRVELFRDDLRICLNCLRNGWGIEQPMFAFPYGKPITGYTDASLVGVVRSFGLPCALTTEPTWVRPSDSPFQWGRFNVYDWDTSTTLAAKLLGHYSWAPQVVERLVRMRSTSRYGTEAPALR